jgi:hypothetical protein
VIVTTKNENMKKKKVHLFKNLNVLNNNGLMYSNHSSYLKCCIELFIIHFRYEQSKVYQYLKQGDLAYNSLVKRKETLFNTQKSAYKDYLIRRDEFCNEKQFQLTILSIAKYFLSRRDQLIKIQEMKDKLIELRNKEKDLIDSKVDKMKAWESVYTQPNKRDLMDFCLQTNIDQALTLSFNQMQQDIWSQPTTPISAPQNEFVSEEQSIIKPSAT